MLRILLALLVACLSTPALAVPVCHDAPRAAAMKHNGHEMPAAPDDRAAPAHVCIGCVPPPARVGAVASAALPAGLTPFAGLTVQLAGRSIMPALPPPRG